MHLNPFDLRGPEFLLFYLLVSVSTVWLVWLWRRASESGAAGQDVAQAREISQDPYRVAFLRGGRYEALHVALVSLLERGLLKASGEYLRSADPDAVNKVRHPLDKAILTRFASRSLAEQGRKAEVVYTDTAILAEADVIGEDLQRRGLLPNDDVKAARKNRIVLAIAFLWLVAGIKIAVAVSRGRANIWFLVVLALIMAPVLIGVSRRFRTALGDRAYDWIQALFTDLRSRRESFSLNNTSSELTFLAAAFGLAALPTTVEGMLSPMNLRPPKPAGVASSGCGSSCASFSSCGGGGGCGGGGCGGGCGGCGG